MVPLADRFRKFNREVVVGRSGWGNHEINRAFEYSTGLTTDDVSAIREAQILKSTGGFRSVLFSLAQLSIRYSCPVGELEELASCIRSADIGSVVKLRVVKDIFDRDYG